MRYGQFSIISFFARTVPLAVPVIFHFSLFLHVSTSLLYLSFFIFLYFARTGPLAVPVIFHFFFFCTYRPACCTCHFSFFSILYVPARLLYLSFFISSIFARTGPLAVPVIFHFSLFCTYRPACCTCHFSFLLFLHVPTCLLYLLFSTFLYFCTYRPVCCTCYFSLFPILHVPPRLLYGPIFLFLYFYTYRPACCTCHFPFSLFLHVPPCLLYVLFFILSIFARIPCKLL